MSRAVSPTGSPSRVALAALLTTAVFLAVTTNLSKIAAAHGVAPSHYLAWSSLGAGGLLLAFAAWRGHNLRPNGRRIEYWFVAALLSVSAPNLIFFSTVGIVGVGFVAVMIALPPMLTYAGALALGMERFTLLRAVGVLLALIGTAVIVLPKLSGSAAPGAAVLLTLLGPVLLAAGNLYRTARWPANAAPEALAPGMMIAASVLVLMAMPLIGTGTNLPEMPRHFGLIAIQAAVFAAQYLAFFVLQKHGGPVYLSLLGAVSAVFAVPIGMIFFDEAAPEGLLPAAALIGFSVFLLARRRPAAESTHPLTKHAGNGRI